MTWQLFIDESGDFGDPSDTCVVAGVLVHAPHHPRNDSRVRAALEAACPGARYPHHTSTSRFVSGRVYMTLAGPRSRDEGTAEGEIAGRVLRVLEEHLGEPSARALLDAIKSGREPDHTSYRDCDRLLWSRAPELADRLKRVMEEDEFRIRQVLGKSAELYGAKAPEGALVVAAVDRRNLDGSEIDDPAVDRDRYLALLTVLLERAAAVLYGRAREIWITAATRHVARRGVGQFPLAIANLGAAARSAMKFPLLAHTPPERAPRFIAAAVPSYGPDVSPGVVLADFVSNRIRASLVGASSLPWWRLAQLLRSRVTLSVDAPSRFISSGSPLPTVAESGPVYSAIWDAFSGSPVDRDLRGQAQWAREQARRWIDAGVAWCASRGAS